MRGICDLTMLLYFFKEQNTNEYMWKNETSNISDVLTFAMTQSAVHIVNPFKWIDLQNQNKHISKTKINSYMIK